ncbi:MAG: stress-responsive transcriptional regulator [Parcubacteria group bacterium LiPW_39]|nr:MAG: stress-responsive transcriptional regulator [Parcubacteria group bacterium LiPW_39]
MVALGGSGILVYLILWLLIPKNPQEPAIISEEKIKEFAQDLKEKAQNLKKEFQKEAKPEAQEIKKRRGYLFGWILVILGALFLFNNFFPWSFHFYAVRYWPLLLVVVGLILISRADSK